jgi:hypothetical protein
MNNKLEKDICLYQTTQEVIVALESAAIGGLAGLLAPSPLNR